MISVHSFNGPSVMDIMMIYKLIEKIMMEIINRIIADGQHVRSRLITAVILGIQGERKTKAPNSTENTGRGSNREHTT